MFDSELLQGLAEGHELLLRPLELLLRHIFSERFELPLQCAMQSGNHTTVCVGCLRSLKCTHSKLIA
jgi:hypothetical protein